MRLKVNITGLADVSKAMTEVEKKLKNHQKTAIRRGLNAGAKELEKAIKPHVPVIRSSTNFRDKGTVKKNVRHTTRVAKDGNGGKTTIHIKRTQKRRMARLRDNTRDKSDPFYWYLLDQGTSKMPGQHFMTKGASQGKAAALNTVKKVVAEEMKKPFKK